MEPSRHAPAFAQPCATRLETIVAVLCSSFASHTLQFVPIKTGTLPSVGAMSYAEEAVRQTFANFQISDNARVHAGNNHYGDNNYYYRHDRPSSPIRPFSNVPFAHDPDYIDRTAISDGIHRKLLPGARLALVGLGGVG